MLELFNPLLNAPQAWTLFLLVTGLLVGSFLNVVIHRLPLMLEKSFTRECQLFMGQTVPAPPTRYNLCTPRSSCPHCQRQLRFWENIPLLSYLLLKGRCSGCRQSISLRYPGIELAAAVLAAVSGAVYGPGLMSVAVCLLGWTLLTLSMIDFDHQILPDAITFPLLWMGLLLNTQELFTSLESAIWGAVAGYLSLWIFFWLFKLATGKEGMGYGDFKLLAALGAWLGWQYLPLMIVLSSLLGACVGLALVALKKQDSSVPLSFGPYLALAGLVALFAGDHIIDAYLTFSGV